MIEYGDFRSSDSAFRGAALSLLFDLLMRGLSFAAISPGVCVPSTSINKVYLNLFYVKPSLLIRELSFE
jgi:hypothetical protein